MKVTTIEEAQDLIIIKVDKLIGFLQTFEMTFNDISEKKNKRITFASNTEENGNQGEEILSEAISLVERKFNKSLRRLDRNSRTNVPNKVSNISPLSKRKDDLKANRGK